MVTSDPFIEGIILKATKPVRTTENLLGQRVYMSGKTRGIRKMKEC